jgi:hypothetical protein
MSTADCGGYAGAYGRDIGHARRIANWLCLAAAPIFASMALATCVLGGEPHMLCSAMDKTSTFSGMTPMYLLMSAFHLPPWLKLIGGGSLSELSG